MAARRGKSQARRNGSRPGGLPGWAWLVLGVVLTLVAVLAVPRLMRGDDGDGFFRPKPNPDAQPAAATTSGQRASDVSSAWLAALSRSSGWARPTAAS